MKALKVLALTAGISLAASSLALATPSGQVWIPSTDAKGYKEVNISIDNYIRTSSKSSGANYFDTGITVGVLPFEKLKLEVGVDYYTDNTNSSDPATRGIYTQHPVLFNAKLATPEDSIAKGSPALAVGMFAIGTAKDKAGTDLNENTKSNIAYGLVAKTLPKVGRISVGAYTGSEANLGVSHQGVMASWDRTLSEISDKLWMAVDYMSGNNAFGALSTGISYSFTPTVSLMVGYNFYQDSAAGGKPTITTQLDFNF